MRAEQIEAGAYEGPEGPEFVDSTAPLEPERKPLFKMPNIREDLRALPSVFRSRRMLWVPLLLLIGGLGIVMAYPGLSPDTQGLASYYIQFFFAPPALFTFFMAGFFAPRASYLVGAVYGLIAGVFWAVAFSGVLPNTVPTTGAPVDPLMSTFASLGYGLLFGTLAGGLAGWYRDFLRGIQERGKARRAVKEVDERAKRREERQEARRTAKRPTS